MLFDALNGDYVLVEVVAPKEKTSGGIYIPEARMEKDTYTMSFGTVVQLGGAVNALNDLDLQVGDFVTFKPYGGQIIEVEKRIYRMINGAEIFAKGDKEKFTTWGVI